MNTPSKYIRVNGCIYRLADDANTEHTLAPTIKVHPFGSRTNFISNYADLLKAVSNISSWANSLPTVYDLPSYENKEIKQQLKPRLEELKKKLTQAQYWIDTLTNELDKLIDD